MNNEYINAMRTLTFSDRDKQEITDWLVQAAEDHAAIHPAARPKRRRSMVMPVAAATLAVLLLVGGAAYASGTFVTVGQAFDYLFNGAPANTAVVDKIGRPLGASATSGGVTLTADAIIGDAHTYSVVYSLAREDGQPFEDLPAPNENDVIPLGFERDSSGPVMFGGGGGTSWFYDADPNDGAIQYVEQYWWEPEGGSSIVGSTMNVDLQDLVRYTNEGTQAIAKGIWKMRFKLNYEDSSLAISAGQAFGLNGMNATLSQASISPVSLYVSYAVDEARPAIYAEGGEANGRLSDESRAVGDRFLNLGTFRIHFADGTTMEVEDNAGGTMSTDAEGRPVAEGTTLCSKSIIFDKVIDPNEVTSIEFCGITIPLN